MHQQSDEGVDTGHTPVGSGGVSAAVSADASADIPAGARRVARGAVLTPDLAPMAEFRHLGRLRRALNECGAGPGHTARFLRAWFRSEALKAGRAKPESYFPSALLAATPALRALLDAQVRLVSEHPAEDGSRRLLLALGDDRTVETVLLPREGVCVSTQIGCAVGCRFCMTGRDGLLRQLGSAEIVAQVVLARRLAPVRKVVFMGMGEPAHNLEAVLEAVDLLGQEGEIAHKQLVFSTVGDERAFSALSTRRIKPALALSLHTTRADLRRTLLPRAPDIAPQDLVQAADDYARLSGYPAQLQWTLLEGINDGDDELAALTVLLKGRRLMLNLIPFNAVEGTGFRRPSWQRAADMARHLNHHGIYTRLRRSAGQDVEGGCGQLRARRPNAATSTDNLEARAPSDPSRHRDQRTPSGFIPLFPSR